MNSQLARHRQAQIEGAICVNSEDSYAIFFSQLFSAETTSLTFWTCSLILLTCGCTSLIKSCSIRSNGVCTELRLERSAGSWASGGCIASHRVRMRCWNSCMEMTQRIEQLSRAG